MLYLTMVRVLANIEADTPDDARERLVRALDVAGFTPYPEGAEAGDVIESEAEEPSGLPEQRGV